MAQAEGLGRAPDANGAPSFAPPGDGACWTALADDTGAGVLVADAQGRFLYCNKSGAKVLGADPRAVAGKEFGDFFSQDVARERTDLVRRVATAGRPLAVDGLIRGRMTRCTHRSLRTETGTAVMLVFTPASCAQNLNGTGDVERVKARHDDAGPLAGLTAREIEILRLIGQGLSTAEIAGALHRSVKTIEWHRVSLGSKLGQSNRVGLARIAIMAGLTSLDAPAPSANE